MNQELEPRSSALRSLYDAYFRDDPERLAALKREMINDEIARLLHDLRDELNLSRDQLALRVSIEPEVIEDLEEGDYEGDSSAVFEAIRLALAGGGAFSGASRDRSDGAVSSPG